MDVVSAQRLSEVCRTCGPEKGGFQKRQHFRNVVRYSCDEVGGNQVQKRGKGSF